MRDRAWRRYIEEKVIKKRLSVFFKWRMNTINGSTTNKPVFSDYISTDDYFKAKTISTDKWSTKNKVKYSPNRNNSYWRDEGKNKSTREFNKKYFLKILKENGLK